MKTSLRRVEQKKKSHRYEFATLSVVLQVYLRVPCHLLTIVLCDVVGRPDMRKSMADSNGGDTSHKTPITPAKIQVNGYSSKKLCLLRCINIQLLDCVPVIKFCASAWGSLRPGCGRLLQECCWTFMLPFICKAKETAFTFFWDAYAWTLICRPGLWWAPVPGHMSSRCISLLSLGNYSFVDVLVNTPHISFFNIKTSHRHITCCRFSF